MATVNRIPFNTVPPEWAFHPTIGPFVRDLLTIVWQQRIRSGGDGDTITDTSIQVDDTLLCAALSRIAHLESLVSSLLSEHDFSSRLADLESKIESLARETAIPTAPIEIDTDMQNTLVYGLIERINAIEAQI